MPKCVFDKEDHFQWLQPNIELKNSKYFHQLLLDPLLNSLLYLARFNSPLELIALEKGVGHSLFPNISVLHIQVQNLMYSSKKCSYHPPPQIEVYFL